MTTHSPALDGFAPLIGIWATTATHPLIDDGASGVTTFEWAVGGQFMLARATTDHDLFPDAVYVIGPPETGEGLAMEYFDSRGVRRTYGVSVDEGVLRIWRDAPGFAQRASATLGPDSFTGRWQLAEEPGDWRDDVTVIFERITRRP